MIDPEAQRWRRKYPNFPGISQCADLLRSPNVSGTWVDIICEELQNRAADSFADFATAIRSEADARVKTLLLAALAEAGLPEATPLLAESLHSREERLKYWAEFGLKKIGTREARGVLWSYHQQTKP